MLFRSNAWMRGREKAPVIVTCRRAEYRALKRGVDRATLVDMVPLTGEEAAGYLRTQFLGQDTAFYIGAEQIARATRLPIVYAAMRRLRRGYYTVEFVPLWDGRERCEPNTVTERYARACEIEVLKSPADWLWSYRRWRLKKPLYGAD